MLQDTAVMGLTFSVTTLSLQTLMYACQRMDNDKQLREYHVPPVSFSSGSAHHNMLFSGQPASLFIAERISFTCTVFCY